MSTPRRTGRVAKLVLLHAAVTVTKTIVKNVTNYRNAKAISWDCRSGSSALQKARLSSQQCSGCEASGACQTGTDRRVTGGALRRRRDSLRG